MKRAFKPRSVALTVAAVMLATLIPTAFADEHPPPPPGPNGPVAGDESVLLLTRGSDDFFQWEDEFENIRTRKNDCTAITFSGADLVTVEATGPDGVLGDVKDGFGELSTSEGSGEPCGRIDAPDQGVAVELSGLLSDHAMSRVDLDLELKFDAIATLTFYADGEQVTPNSVRRSADGSPEPISDGVATFDPESLTGDNGPDSKDGDNYRMYAEPLDCEQGGEDGPECTSVLFDRIVVGAAQGSVALEGGADLQSNNPDSNSFGQIDPTSLSSQFGVVSTFDGSLECGDTVQIGDGIETAQGTFDRLVYGDCETKFYDLDTSADQIDFAPADGTTARYSAELTSIPYATENPVTQKLEYDPDLDGTFQPMQWCLTDPADWAAVADSATVLPSGETWCITGATTDLLPDGEIQTTWTVIGEDDPGFRFS